MIALESLFLLISSKRWRTEKPAKLLLFAYFSHNKSHNPQSWHGPLACFLPLFYSLSGPSGISSDIEELLLIDINHNLRSEAHFHQLKFRKF